MKGKFVGVKVLDKYIEPQFLSTGLYFDKEAGSYLHKFYLAVPKNSYCEQKIQKHKYSTSIFFKVIVRTGTDEFGQYEEYFEVQKFDNFDFGDRCSEQRYNAVNSVPTRIPTNKPGTVKISV